MGEKGKVCFMVELLNENIKQTQKAAAAPPLVARVLIITILLLILLPWNRKLLFD